MRLDVQYDFILAVERQDGYAGIIVDPDHMYPTIIRIMRALLAHEETPPSYITSIVEGARLLPDAAWSMALADLYTLDNVDFAMRAVALDYARQLMLAILRESFAEPIHVRIIRRGDRWRY